MQEINLLQNKIKDRTLSFERSNRLVIILFVLLMVMELVASGGLYVLSRANTTKAQELQQQNKATQASLNATKKDLSAAQGTQAQLINLRTLLKNHISWSPFFDNLSALTAKKVQFVSLSGSTVDGRIDLSGNAINYDEIGKLILSLNSSGKFSNVKLSTISPSSTKNFGYSFHITTAANSTNFKKQ